MDQRLLMQVEAKACCRAWECTRAGAALRTDAALLWPVERGAQALMLKVPGEGSDEAGAAEVLAALNGQWAVRLVAQQGRVLLMERVEPVGRSLEAMALDGQDDAATGLLCDVALGMQAALAGAVLPGLIPLDRRMGDLARRDAVPVARHALMDWAVAEVGGLLADRTNWTALHGDLHHFNVLCDRDRGWLAIDPKGVFGPPVYDLANGLLNPYPHRALVLDQARMAQQAAIVAEWFGLTPREVLHWVALHGCLATAWCGRDAEGGYWEAGARLAGRLGGLPLPD